jgi:hypothetical protein
MREEIKGSAISRGVISAQDLFLKDPIFLANEEIETKFKAKINNPNDFIRTP